MENLFQRIDLVLDDTVKTTFEDGEWQVCVTEVGVPLTSKFPSEVLARTFASHEETRLRSSKKM